MSGLLAALQAGPARLEALLDAEPALLEQLIPDDSEHGPGDCPPLVRAAYEGRTDSALLLFRRGADPWRVSSRGGCALDHLCSRGKAAAMEEMLKSWRGGEEELKRLLDAPREKGWTLLMQAAMAPSLPCTQVLLAASADVNAEGTEGGTALDLAAQQGGRRGAGLVAALLAAGADANKGCIGPLFLAVQENDEASVKALLAAKARVEGIRTGEEGARTPVETAAMFGFARLLKLLLAAEGAPGGVALAPALALARERQHGDAERLLLKAGAEPGTGGKRGAATDLEAWALPKGLAPGAEPSTVAEGEVAGTIVVEEGDGVYLAKFQGRANMLATALSPAVLSAEHPCYYFEVALVELGLVAALGFARHGTAPRNMLPGWTEDTYGLHSDDGLLQANGSETKVMKAWTAKEGCTLGMGVEFAEDEYRLFVTLDGARQSKNVPLADDKDESFELFPIVGADRDSLLRVNFGEQPFLFQDEALNAALARRRAAAAGKRAKTT